ncbi:MAG: FKBP-type peptidyl-prolyl cis-trans isomerase [Bacteroidaceae bacterium]
METNNKHITVAYELYAANSDSKSELIEKAFTEHPFQFISGMGLTLEKFESNLLPLKEGEKFDFTLSVEDGYGEYMKDRVLELDKNIFSVEGRFDKDQIYPGASVPMMNDDGNRFEGLVLEVREDLVVMDFNNRLAGKELHFVGEVISARDATEEEIQAIIKRLSGEGCGCGCDSCGDDCDCDGDKEEGCGCGNCH